MNKPVFDRIIAWEGEGGVHHYGIAGRSEAPVLLLLHAIRNTKMLFAGIVPALAKTFRVIAVDLRGHGQASAKGPYTFEQIVDDLVAVLDAEKAERVTVVAASFSAVPAQMLAAKYSQRVSGLILLDGGFYRLSDMPGFSRDQVVERLASTRFASVEAAEKQFADRYGKGDLSAGWMQHELEQKEDGLFGYRLPAAAFSAYFQAYADYDKEALFSKLSCPVLLLMADEKLLPDDRQRAFFREAAQEYMRAVGQVQVKMIEGSQHLIMVTNPRETVAEIEHFCKKQGTS